MSKLFGSKKGAKAREKLMKAKGKWLDSKTVTGIAPGRAGSNTGRAPVTPLGPPNDRLGGK